MTKPVSRLPAVNGRTGWLKKPAKKPVLRGATKNDPAVQNPADEAPADPAAPDTPGDPSIQNPADEAPAGDPSIQNPADEVDPNWSPNLYEDSTTTAVDDVNSIVTDYEFNLPVYGDSGMGHLPSDIYQGPKTPLLKGFLIQDPNVTLGNSLPIDGTDSTKTSGTITFQAPTKKYGFRFLYNPPDVSMSVGFSAGVDYKVTQNTADHMKSPLVPQTGSSVQFEILINRINDLAAEAPNPSRYAATVLDGQIDAIQKKGTMADVEYLLRALNSGLTMKTKYRGTTADFGWISGGAVVIKLGPGIVYQGMVDSISLNHTRFTANMIPVMTSVQITLSRYADILPDSVERYAEEVTKTGADAAAPAPTTDTPTP